MDCLTDFSTYCHLPSDPVYDIRRYFQIEYLHHRVADEKQLLGSMNHDLQIKKLKHTYTRRLEGSQLLLGIPADHFYNLYDSVTESFARKGDKLFSEGDNPSCSYVLRKGGV